MAKKMYEVTGFIEERPRRILELCEYLTPVMNEIHGTDYSFRFWATLLKDYVKTCLNREKMMSLKKITSKPLLLPDNSWELPGTAERWKIRLRYAVNVLLKNSSITKVQTIIRDSDNICVGLRAEYLEEYGLGVYCPNHYPLCISLTGRGKRKKTYTIAKEEDSIFQKNVVRQLPLYYVEYFDSLTGKIKLINPEDKTFHAEHISAFMEMIIAYYVEHGAQYFRYQYGGFVGETEESVAEDKYIDIDRLRTYGWKINEKDEPYKAFRLEQFSNKYHNIEDTAEYAAVIIYNQINNEPRKKRYKEFSEKIFKGIKQDKYPKLLLRPRGFSRKIDNSSELAYLNAPDFVTVDQGKMPMANIVKSAKIVIHLSHPSTNFLECVYVNHPVVAILTNDRPTDIIEPFYQFFLDEKVMHHDIDTMIDHLNSVDLDSWWNELIQKPMYQEFKDKFAREV